MTGFMPSTRPADLINSFSAGVRRILRSAVLAESYLYLFYRESAAMGKTGSMIAPACRHEATKRRGIWESSRDVSAGLWFPCWSLTVGKLADGSYPNILADSWGGLLVLQDRVDSRSELRQGG